MTAPAPLPDADVNLTPPAEQEFRRECERVGGLVIDRDEATRNSAAYNFLADVELVLVALQA